jgi:excisionase family DNA binding protein
MKTSNKTKWYLTPNEVAEMLMVSPVTVRQWAKKGELKALNTPGGHRRFMRRDIERFARDRGLALQPAEGDRTRVLIVDDDEQIRGYLVELLAECSGDVTVETARDGFEAGQKVNTFQPHVLLLDLMMPGLNGFEVCRFLKEQPATKAIRIVAMTGYATKENVDLILSAGAERCVAKPLDPDALLEALGLELKQSVR